jgi:hypothetical protein
MDDIEIAAGAIKSLLKMQLESELHLKVRHIKISSSSSQ